MEKPLVIIPAYNEAAGISRTLRALTKDCRPVVAVNGSTDNTAEIAASFGAEVYVFDEPGKDAAFRGTLRKLGTQALEPFLITDADSVPFRPQKWPYAMIRPISETRPGIPVAVAGLLGSRPSWASSPASFPSFYRTARMFQTIRHMYMNDLYHPSGANTALRLNRQTLDKLLDNPEVYWPGEDQYYYDEVKHHDGKIVQLISLDSAVFPDSRRLPPLGRKILLGKEAADCETLTDYRKRGALQPGVIPYSSTSFAIPARDRPVIAQAMPH